jgi:hypothetical protein
MFTYDPHWLSFWGVNPWDVIPIRFPDGALCYFCQTPLEGLQIYAVLMDIPLYVHLDCLNKAVDKI